MKNRQAFLLFSHQLTAEQELELRRDWQVTKLRSLPKDLLELWSNVPPELDSLFEYLEPLFDWLAKEAHFGDVAIIQGEFGAVYLAVVKAFELGLIPIYATTRREVQETKLPDGSVKQERLFKHVKFRLYGR